MGIGSGLCRACRRAFGAYLSHLGAFPDGVVVAIASCAGGLGLIVFYLIARKQVS